MATLNLFKILPLTHKRSRHPSTENRDVKVSVRDSIWKTTFSRLRETHCSPETSDRHWWPEQCFRGELMSSPVFSPSVWNLTIIWINKTKRWNLFGAKSLGDETKHTVCRSKVSRGLCGGFSFPRVRPGPPALLWKVKPAVKTLIMTCFQ